MNYIYFGWIRDDASCNVRKSGRWGDMGGEVINHVNEKLRAI